MSFTSIKVRLEERRWLKEEAARREVPMYRLMAEIVATARDLPPPPRPPPPAPLPPDAHADDALRELVTMLYLYPTHALDARGPSGCVFRAIEALSPELAAAINREGADAVFLARFDEDADEDAAC